ncbi:MAG: hypothetical protein KJO11_12160 [Gemmatimonadetes bacterium]|nr:hypothetical protein [Gemmatimonadota bacterium]MBT8405002.1 hypothetical protein [Gemmatimonadota bacterium]NNK64506.1 hypothetical protein [Gemmatimonadota bacterium]
MARFKPLLFIVGISLVSAVTLRLLVGRIEQAMRPGAAAPVRPDSAEMDRRFVGCGHFRFVLDSLGYRTGQWPAEVDSGLAATRVDATFLARDGRILAAGEGSPGPELGDYRIVADTVYVRLGPQPGGFRARLGTVGDSLGGRLEASTRLEPMPVVGRLFLARPVPIPTACRSG